jgi:uncharacterized lipoprotein NlpE involved in copper resistance
MKKVFFLAGIIGLFCYSCDKKTDVVSVPNTVEQQMHDTSKDSSAQALSLGDNSKNSLDWAGVYKGITPCANCEGIETELSLNADFSFELQTKYLGKGDEKLHSIKGKFTWNFDGSTVLLENLEDRPSQYKVGENQLIQLDMKGQVIKGDLASNYVLKKVQ